MGDRADDLGDDTLRLVVVQRERARKHASELEAENRRYADQCKAHQSELRKLSADNMRLYEKAKFFEAQAASAASGASGGAKGGAAPPLCRNSIAEASTEGRYAGMYEEKVNPFAAFHRSERQKRYDSMNPADKVVLNFAKFAAGNKHVRMGFVGYMVVLHLVLWVNVYSHMLHHADETPARCT